MKSDLVSCSAPPDEPHVPAIFDSTPSASLTRRQVAKLILSGRIVDGRAGGLLFGRSILEGGVAAIYKFGSRYEFRGWLEGGSYLVNWRAATEHLNRLKAMNAGLTMKELTPNSPSPSDPADIASPVVTFGQPDDRIVLLNWAQVVVSPEPTAKHLLELEEINRCPNPYTRCDLREVFGWERSADDII
jgi:hypothetical protein